MDYMAEIYLNYQTIHIDELIGPKGKNQKSMRDLLPDALIYYTIVKEVLGEKWLTNQWFRMGTSRLANLLLSEVIGEETKFF